MLVSIIIPTYNREATIGAAVESALAQTHRPVEVIVVDDGSKDGTLAALQRFGDAITVVAQENAGPSAARNRGVAAAKGEVLAFLDSDDAWLPTKIARQAEMLEKAGPRMACCVCNASILGFSGEPAGTSFQNAGLYPAQDEGEWSNPGEVLATRFLLFNQVVAVRKDAFHKVGGFNRALRILEDYELAMKLSTAGTWGIISEPLVVKRNDTDGIGVSCMNDRLAHARHCVSVVEGLAGGGHGFDKPTMTQLDRTIAELRCELRAENRLAEGQGVSAKLSLAALRVRRALRRRSPSWPRPVVSPL
jgi:glycosyltransferase involved in cell wall biosynthesis